MPNMAAVATLVVLTSSSAIPLTAVLSAPRSAFGSPGSVFACPEPENAVISAALLGMPEHPGAGSLVGCRLSSLPSSTSTSGSHNLTSNPGTQIRSSASLDLSSEGNLEFMQLFSLDDWKQPLSKELSSGGVPNKN